MFSEQVAGRAAPGVCAVFFATTLWACGGVEVPLHDGYRNKKTKGWEKPKLLEFDEDREAESEGELSYPKRKRALWFAVDTPSDGDLEVTLEVLPLGYAAENQDLEDEEDPFDVAFEIYNDKYKQLTRADREENDAGEPKRSRTALMLPRGRYLIHVFLQRRLDAAEYILRVKHKVGSIEPETDFPAQVAFVEPLPVVPAFDDAPDRPTRRRSRRARSSRKKNDKKPKDNGAKPPSGDSMSARIIGIRQSASGGTHITINAGASKGVEEGWKGRVITKKGKAIPGGTFRIKRVNARTSTATVSGASPDAVSGAKRVRISPP